MPQNNKIIIGKILQCHLHSTLQILWNLFIKVTLDFFFHGTWRYVDVAWLRLFLQTTLAVYLECQWFWGIFKVNIFFNADVINSKLMHHQTISTTEEIKIIEGWSNIILFLFITTIINDFALACMCVVILSKDGSRIHEFDNLFWLPQN